MALRDLKLSDECINECLSALRERLEWSDENQNTAAGAKEWASEELWRQRSAKIRAAHAELLKAQAGQ